MSLSGINKTLSSFIILDFPVHLSFPMNIVFMIQTIRALGELICSDTCALFAQHKEQNCLHLTVFRLSHMSSCGFTVNTKNIRRWT